MTDVIGMTKEQIHDEQINPLMAKIISICTEHPLMLSKEEKEATRI